MAVQLSSTSWYQKSDDGLPLPLSTLGRYVTRASMSFKNAICWCSLCSYQVLVGIRTLKGFLSHQVSWVDCCI